MRRADREMAARSDHRLDVLEWLLWGGREPNGGPVEPSILDRLEDVETALARRESDDNDRPTSEIEWETRLLYKDAVIDSLEVSLRRAMRARNDAIRDADVAMRARDRAIRELSVVRAKEVCEGDSDG